MAIERILGTDTGKAAFEKSDRNFVGLEANKANLTDLDYSKGFAYADFYNTSMLPGRYTIYSSTVLHPPYSGVLSGLIDVRHIASGELFFEFRPWNSLEIYLLNYSNYTWSGWQKISTDKQPSWIAATLQNGWTGTLQYRKNAIGEVEIRARIISGTITIYTVVAQLPAEYSSLYTKPLLLTEAQTGKIVSLYMSDSAAIAVANGITFQAGNTYVGGTSYYV